MATPKTTIDPTKQTEVLNSVPGQSLFDTNTPEQIASATGGAIPNALPVPQVAPQATDLSKVGTGSVGPDGKPIYDVFAGQEHIADPNDPRLKGVDISTLADSQAPAGFKSKFEKGFNIAQGAGEKAPDSGGGGASLVKTYAPATAPTNPIVENFYKEDPTMTALIKSFQEYTSPANQKASLADTYKQMMKDSGVEALDMELINDKNIIEGSEEDIRTEITKAGGFATESQVQGLTNARNKQLIKNYNKLVDMRNAKSSYLNTMIGLEADDRTAADTKFNNAFNMATQISTLQQQMKKNAVESLDRTQKAIGWDGIFQATQGDPYTQALVEKTYGLPMGGLALAAQQAINVKQQVEEKRLLDLEETQAGVDLKKEQIKMSPLERALKTEQIKTEKAQQAKTYADITEKRATTPGTPEYKEAQKKALGSQAIKAEVVLGKVKEAKKLIGGMTGGSFSTGLIGGLTSWLGGTPAKNLKTKLDTIQANLSFDTLQEMRNASKTGGALGSVSERELELLGATVASLDVGQSASELENSLKQINEHYTNWLTTNGYSVAPDGKIIQITD